MLSLKLISVFTILITLVICGRGKYKYKYNHLTQSDIYVSIPVSVVYENGNRMDKSIDSIVSSSSKPESTTNLVTEESSNEHTINVQKYTTKELITSTSSEYSTTELITSSSFEYMTIFNNYNESHSVDNATKQKESSITPNLETKVEKHIYDQRGKRTFEDENKYSIPVAVIYDPEPETSEKSAIETKMRQKKDHIDTSNEEKVRGSLNIKLQEEKKNIPLEITDSKPNKRVRERNPVTPIIRSENYVYSHSGDFHYSYEGGDGTKAFMSGELRTVDDNAGEAVSGSYSYIGKDGKDYSISYTADENGYRPVGDHLPTPPPIPPAIARALKYLATKSTIEPITVALK